MRPRATWVGETRVTWVGEDDGVDDAELDVVHGDLAQLADELHRAVQQVRAPAHVRAAVLRHRQALSEAHRAVTVQRSVSKRATT